MTARALADGAKGITAGPGFTFNAARGTGGSAHDTQHVSHPGRFGLPRDRREGLWSPAQPPASGLRLLPSLAAHASARLGRWRLLRSCPLPLARTRRLGLTLGCPPRAERQASRSDDSCRGWLPRVCLPCPQPPGDGVKTRHTTHTQAHKALPVPALPPPLHTPLRHTWLPPLFGHTKLPLPQGLCMCHSLCL